jgi:predicted DNA-binding protein
MTSLRMSAAMAEKLTSIAQAYGVPEANVVRIALWDLLEKMDPGNLDFKFFNVLGQLPNRETSHAVLAKPVKVDAEGKIVRDADGNPVTE